MQHLRIPAHTQGVTQVLSALESDATSGLTELQMRQRLELYGLNRLQEQPGLPLALRLPALTPVRMAIPSSTWLIG